MLMCLAVKEEEEHISRLLHYATKVFWLQAKPWKFMRQSSATAMANIKKTLSHFFAGVLTLLIISLFKYPGNNVQEKVDFNGLHISSVYGSHVCVLNFLVEKSWS